MSSAAEAVLIESMSGVLSVAETATPVADLEDFVDLREIDAAREEYQHEGRDSLISLENYERSRRERGI